MPDESPEPDQAAPHVRHRAIVIWVISLFVAATVAGLAIWHFAGSSATASGSAPHYVDDTAATGIDHKYTGDGEYFVGGGVAAFDCNGDGRDDLYLAGGASPAGLYLNESPVGGALRFTHRASPVTDLTQVTGAYPIDIDNDGIVDLVVLRNGPNRVLRGMKDCKFEDVTDSLGIAAGNDWTVGFSATWEGSNSLPTLAFGTYRVPATNSCGDSRLVRPDSTGHRYSAPIALGPGYCSLSLLFSDWNRSGQRDLRVANDRNYYRTGQEQMWKVAPGKPPRLYSEAEGWRALQIWGMGIASYDLTGDGRPEVFLTSQGDNKLQTLEPGATGPSFHDIALERGVTVQRPYAGGDVRPSTSWHPEFDDVNNDGNIDLFVTKGNVDAQPDNATRDPNNLLIGRSDGTFTEGAPAAGIVRYDRARGAALVDLNLDGMLDLVVVNRQANVTVWRNVGSGTAQKPVAMGHWLSLRLHQKATNVDAIGSWVEMRIGNRTIVREITVGGGHAGGKLGWIHEGLGSATSADIRVQWPDGHYGPWTTIKADQFVSIDRDAPTPVPWSPR